MNEYCAMCHQPISETRGCTAEDGMHFHRNPCYHQYTIEKQRQAAFNAQLLAQELDCYQLDDDNLGDA